MAWYDKIAEFGKGVWDGAVEGVSDLAAVGAQVGKGVLDTGAAVLNGAKTAITDPGKFVSDVQDNLATWGGHIQKSWEAGTSMIQDGWEDVQKGGSPGLMFFKTVGGLAQISSLGASSVIGEHFAENVEAEIDEFGNVAGYHTKDGADAITRVLTKKFGSTVATTVNANKEIEEALDAGDTDTANKIFGDTAWVTVGRPLAKVAGAAGVVAGIVAIPVSGGLSTGLTVASASLLFGSTATSMIANSKEAKFDAFNVQDDALDAAQAEAAAMVAAGKLSEDDVDRYVEIVRTVNENQTYKSVSGDYAEENGFANADEMKAYILQANGLPAPDAQDMLHPDYAALVNEGYVTQSTAERLTVLRAGCESGTVTERELREATVVGLLDSTDISDSQKQAYAGHVCDLQDGITTEDGFYAALQSDPELSGFFGSDGTFAFPEKQPSLSASVSEAAAAAQAGAQAAAQAASGFEPEPAASENQAIMEEALAQMGYA